MSSLGRYRLDMKRDYGQLCRFRLDGGDDAERGQRPLDDASGEIQELQGEGGLRCIFFGQLVRERLYWGKYCVRVKRTGLARTTAWPPASVLMRAIGRKCASVRT